MNPHLLGNPSYNAKDQILGYCTSALPHQLPSALTLGTTWKISRVTDISLRKINSVNICCWLFINSSPLVLFYSAHSVVSSRSQTVTNTTTSCVLHQIEKPAHSKPQSVAFPPGASPVCTPFIVHYCSTSAGLTVF